MSRKATRPPLIPDDLPPIQAERLRRALAMDSDDALADEVLADGQEEVFSRAEVERGVKAH